MKEIICAQQSRETEDAVRVQRHKKMQIARQHRGAKAQRTEVVPLLP